VKLGSLLSCTLAALTLSFLHLFGQRDTYLFGVWTIPNALVVDLGAVTLVVTSVVWTVVGSVFILCFRLPSSSWLHISPYTISENLRKASRNLSYTLLHTPVFQILDAKWKVSGRAFQLMMAKSLILWIALFAFIVMPTCTVVTVMREQWLHHLSVQSTKTDIPDYSTPIPLSCGDMFPDEADVWTTIDSKHADVNAKYFESLCWQYSKIFNFVIVFGSIYGLLISVLAVFTAAIQFGKSSKGQN
jgi:hypothetical protein